MGCTFTHYPVDRRVGAAQHNPPLAQFDGLHPSYFTPKVSSWRIVRYDGDRPSPASTIM